MKNKGQALVEFVIIIPILLMIIMILIDFGNIFYKKYTLESDLDYIVDLYNNNELQEISDYASKEKFSFSYKSLNNKTTIVLKKDVQINTPILNEILDNPYKVIVERVIYEK